MTEGQQYRCDGCDALSVPGKGAPTSDCHVCGSREHGWSPVPAVVTLDSARANIGRGVIYQAHPDAPIEQGTIDYIGVQYVFVRYQGDMYSKATRPEDLRWMTP